MIIASYFNGIRTEKLRYKFHASQIEGIITYKYSSSGGDRISINEEEEKRYVFVQYNQEIGMHFSSFLELGDSIFKAPQAELLYLFKEEKMYAFKIKKNKQRWKPIK